MPVDTGALAIWPELTPVVYWAWVPAAQRCVTKLVITGEPMVFFLPDCGDRREKARKALQSRCADGSWHGGGWVDLH